MSTNRDLIDWSVLPESVSDRAIERTVFYADNPSWGDAAKGKSVCLLFFNASVRTRTSMELAAAQLGAHCTVLNVGAGTWGFEFGGGVMDGDKAEHIEEAIAVLSQYYDGLGVRLFASLSDKGADESDAILTQIAEIASVPVVNLESASFHPCQALADAATLTQEFRGQVAGKKLALTWAYHPRALPHAVPNSTLLMASRLGMDVTVARPSGFALSRDVMAKAATSAAVSGGSVHETDDYEAALSGADVIYAKAWAGRGIYDNPDEEAGLRGQYQGKKVSSNWFEGTNNALFMHCLPVRRGIVVDTDVLRREKSIHIKQAGNRLPAQKAILEYVWNL